MVVTQVIIRKLPKCPNNFLFNLTKFTTIRHKSTKEPIPSSSSSSSSSSSDDDIKQKPSNEDAITKLNALLQQLVANNDKKIELAKPVNRREEGRQLKESITSQSVEKQVVKAVKGVAETLGGDMKQTESELLMKLLSPTDGQHGNLSDLLRGMKIERDVKPEQSKADQVRSILEIVRSQERSTEERKDPRKFQRPRQQPQASIGEPERIALYNTEPLGIFTDVQNLKESPQLPTWQRLYEKEMKLATTHPPSNYFQQIILWTEQGKLWKFPIDNQDGLDAEASVYFADHVFLEEHLEPWCPSKGPIRHFMELVCVGLSKNSYLTVEAKKEHIEWYKNYFEEKRALLQEVGAFPANDNVQKSIE